QSNLAWFLGTSVPWSRSWEVLMEWIADLVGPGLAQAMQVDAILYDGRSAFQHIQVATSRLFGRMLILDDAIQTTERDEYTYHEMLAHLPLVTHPAPQPSPATGCWWRRARRCSISGTSPRWCAAIWRPPSRSSAPTGHRCPPTPASCGVSRMGASDTTRGGSPTRRLPTAWPRFRPV